MKRDGLVLVVISVFLMFIGFSFEITGNFINSYFDRTFNVVHIIGMIMLLGGLALIIEKKSLEYYIIPTGWEKSRIKNAEEEIDKKHYDEVIITGNASGWQHRNKIYKAIRKKGVSRKDIRIVNGIDSEEDILYLGEILKKGDTVYFDTFPAHYAKYKQLIKKAQKEHLFPKGVEVKLSKIEQNGFPEHLYYISALEEALKSRKLDFKSNRNPDKLNNLKSWLKKRKTGYNEK